MFIKQFQLIVAALTCSLSAICAYLYQEQVLKGVAILGLLWSLYSCYKIFSFNFTDEPLAKQSKNKKESHPSKIEIVSQKQPELFLRNREAPNNINKEPKIALKQEPIISKNLSKISKF